MSIPASQIVDVIPGVIGTGGNPLALNAVFLTHDGNVPIGTVLPFETKDEVANFFGPTSPEALLAATYFLGFDNSTKKPGTLFFYQYPTAAVAGYMRSGSLAGMTLEELQSLTGDLHVSIDGTAHDGVGIDLSTATSFSSAATIIGTALSAMVTYNSQLQAFVITSGSTGDSSSVGFATGSLSASLFMTEATGAVLSPGSVAGVPADAMNQIAGVTMNWASFMTVWGWFGGVGINEPLEFAQWVNDQNNRFLFVEWDEDPNAIAANNTASFGFQADAAGYNACCPVYGTADKAAFVCGSIASIDFTARNGRTNLAFKGQAGLTPDVVDADTATNLQGNSYNYYGDYATANQEFMFFYPGKVTGEFNWLDSYVNQIYLNSQFQLALLELLVTAKNIPYNPFGYGMIMSAAQDPINEALNFGSIQPNVTLSSAQAAEVNQEAGVQIDTVLSTRGWYLQVLDATPQVRGQRKSPPCKFWYTDGESVQQITLSSINVQ